MTPRSVQWRMLAGAVWTLLFRVTGARAIAITPIYEAYTSVILAIGGFLLGAIVVVVLMCFNWKVATVRLQPRERRMWELAPLPGLSENDAKILEKLHDEADKPRKRKRTTDTVKKGQPASAASPKNAVSPSANSNPSRSAGPVNPDNNVSRPNPYVNTEDDVVAFNNSATDKFVYM